MKVVLDNGAFLPSSAHEEDAGYDLRTPYDVVVPGCSGCTDAWDNSTRIRVGSAIIDTGVHVEIPRGYVGMIKSKSGLNFKNNITAEGVIDCGYTGSIVVKLYNHGHEPRTFHKGDKITQLVIMPIFKPELELVDSLENTARGAGGFGSTGK